MQTCTGTQEWTRHHDQAASVQISFAKDDRSLVTVIEELGNPFEEESQDLLARKLQILLQWRQSVVSRG